jgi:hypothetical protein
MHALMDTHYARCQSTQLGPTHWILALAAASNERVKGLTYPQVGGQQGIVLDTMHSAFGRAAAIPNKETRMTVMVVKRITLGKAWWVGR